MKKLCALLAVLVLVLAFTACGKNESEEKPTDTPTPTAVQETPSPEPTATDTPAPEPTATATPEPVATETPTPEPTPSGNAKGEGVMTYAQYLAAKDDDEVVIECYVQAHQSWWDNKITVYAADEDGAYFIYNMVCSEADAAKLVPGTKIKVKGFRTTWSGEVEVAEGATFEFEEGSYIAKAVDVTDLLGKEELIDKQNQFVSFKGLKVESAATYKHDGSGQQGDDLYFKVSKDGATYTFTVESYLCGKDTDVYKAVEALKEGDVVDLEGFLYWYNGVNPHITKCTAAGAADASVMTYAQYVAAADDDEILIECYVQAHQSWWDNKITVYAADKDGGYFIYNMVCSEADAAKLVPGTKIRVKGYRATWAEEIEVAEGATFEFVEGADSYVAAPVDVTNLLGTNELSDKMNQYVSFKGLQVTNEASYKHDGSGQPGDDLYFSVRSIDATYTFTVESYLCGKDTDVYKAVEGLKVGDIVDLEGFLYWYNGVNPHITKCTAAGAADASVMTYAQYVAAADDDEILIECYVQAHQSWWDNKITVYAADKDGGYFIYNMVCSEADAAKLVPGTKIRVKGYRATWAEEIEVAEGATFEFVEGADSYVAAPVDVTNLLGTNELSDKMNQYVSFKGLQVTNEASYKHDGSGQPGDDLYFSVRSIDATYTFTVESYLCGKDTDVYKAVEGLKVGDIVDLEGFLYWYNGVNPHITKCTVVPADTKAEGVMTYAEYIAAENDDEILIECYVQAHQSWWDNKITVYAADKDGAYFIYNMVCSEEDSKKLVPGTKIRVKGYRTAWSGEIEVAEGATFEFVEGADSYIAEAVDLTQYIDGSQIASQVPEIIAAMNRFFTLKGLTVTNEASYKYDGSGERGDDLYFRVRLNGVSFSLVVESYLCDKDSDVYKAVEALKQGDVIDIEGFLYWYNGMQPHVTKVTVAQ